jgi:hydrogenase maturation protein HypF
MGRLFDAVAALIGIRQSVNYEAQAAIEMEAISTDVRNAVPYPFLITSDAPHRIDPSPLLSAIFDDVMSCVAPSVIAERFHASIAYLIRDMCVAARREIGLNQVALSGGVFQNKLLLEHTLELLEASKFEVLTHRMVPPNDGGLALGQAMVAAASIPFS